MLYRGNRQGKQPHENHDRGKRARSDDLRGRDTALGLQPKEFVNRKTEAVREAAVLTQAISVRSRASRVRSMAICVLKSGLVTPDSP